MQEIGRMNYLTSFTKTLRSLRNMIRQCVQVIRKSIHDHRSDPLKTWEIAFVILVSDEVHNYMSRLQIDILRRFGVNPGLKAIPHITIKMGFKVADIEPFVRYFDELTGNIDPFEIRVKGIGSFDEGIIFMDVEKNPKLEKLRQRVLGDLSAKYGIQPCLVEDDRFHYHATLAYDLPKDDFINARQALKDTKDEFHFVADTFALFCHTGDEWIAYKRATLSKSPGNPLYNK
jgi:2'-5' RNA ligase